MEDLGEVLKALGPAAPDAAVLVGLDEADDAAVIRVEGGVALVATVDFFTPVVDDAYTWGAIACANACSDVYAMGGRPLFGLNIAGWPRDTLPLSLLGEVLRGGLDTGRRAGMALVGGHTVDDPEPKYGMCVVGTADPDRLMTIAGARPGDLLVLTKPIGTGVITTALKAGSAPAEALDAATSCMTRLNDQASAALVAAGVRACTDVTGFGLLGHLHRMAAASGVACEIDARAVPLLPGVGELVGAGHVPGGTRRNRDAMRTRVDLHGVDEELEILLCDAQTSGGLLAACPAARVDELMAGLGEEPGRAVIGRVEQGPAGVIRVSA